MTPNRVFMGNSWGLEYNWSTIKTGNQIFFVQVFNGFYHSSNKFVVYI